MIIHQIPVGGMRNFCYVVADENTGRCIIVDPSWDLEKVDEVVTRNALKVLHIVNTHSHFDHTIGNEAMRDKTGAGIIQHEASHLPHDLSVGNGEIIHFGESTLHVLHTPGHTKDSICLVGDGKILTGDTLFVGSCGRVDLPGGSARELYHSIFDVLYALDDHTEIYSGHDYGRTPVSTIGDEKRTNVVMQKRTEEEFVRMMG